MCRRIYVGLMVTCVLIFSVAGTHAQDDRGDFDAMALYEARAEGFAWEIIDSYVGEDLAGTTVTILGFDPDAAMRFEQTFAPFEAVTGIDVQYVEDYALETVLFEGIESGNPPDIVAYPNVGFLESVTYAAIPVSGNIFEIMSSEEFHPDWSRMLTFNGQLMGVVHGANPKSLIWYNPSQFEAYGYQVPVTWDQLIALSDDMVADGVTPWCIGFESGDATGWALTDWVEDVLLRTATPETYDAWIGHEMPFNSEAVVGAMNLVGAIVRNPDYIHGGMDAVNAINFMDSPLGLFPEPGQAPDCFLHHQAGFISAFFPEGARIAPDGDAWAFPVPVIYEKVGAPLVVNTSYYMAFSDRPEVMQVMNYLVEPISQELSMAQGGFVPTSRIANIGLSPTEEYFLYAEMLRGAEVIRPDASDHMPWPVVGRWWTALVDWVNGASTEDVLAFVEAEWQALDE